MCRPCLFSLVPLASYEDSMHQQTEVVAPRLSLESVYPSPAVA